LRKGLEAGLDPSDILHGWEAGTFAFERLREPYLLYT